MTFAAPWALLGLLSLPLLIWLHVRRRRPPVVQSASLMFVLDEEERTRLPRGRRLDAEMLLTLTAATLLSLAAAGPTTAAREAARVVRVAVVGGASATRSGYSDDVQSTIESMGRALESGDRLDVQWVPPRQGDWALAPHPSIERVLGVARAGEATVRYVISDRAPDDLPDDVAWIALGRPDAYSPGIVSAQVIRGAPNPQLHVVVAHASERVPAGVTIGSTTTPLTTSRTPGISTALIRLPPGNQPVSVTLDVDKDDILFEDNVISVSSSALRIHVAPDLPAPLQAAVRAALTAVAGDVEETDATSADLIVGTTRPRSQAGWFVGLVSSIGDVTVNIPRGAEIRASSSLVRDLTLDGTAWRYPDVRPAYEESAVLLARQTDEGTWPVLVREGARGVRLLTVPPAPQSAFWPLFFSNVLDTMRGAHDAGFGYRLRGVLDPNVTAIGREEMPFRPNALAAVPREMLDVTTPWRVPCLLLALALLGMLWLLPAFRERQPLVRTA